MGYFNIHGLGIFNSILYSGTNVLNGTTIWNTWGRAVLIVTETAGSYWSMGTEIYNSSNVRVASNLSYAPDSSASNWDSSSIICPEGHYAKIYSEHGNRVVIFG